MALRLPQNPGFYVSDSAHRASTSLREVAIYIFDVDRQWTLNGERVPQDKLPQDLWRLRLEQR